MRTAISQTSALAVMICASSIFAIGGDYDYQNRCAPSAKAPVNNPPQLVILGSDDNTSIEGMKWILDFIATQKNPDGSPIKMSFYSNTSTWPEGFSELKEQHLRAYKMGNEVSSHLDRHVVCTSPTIRLSDSTILANMNAASDKFVALGIKPEHMKGFRTPYLAYSDSTFSAAVQAGFTYDCSIYDAVFLKTGEAFWPYTLDTKNNFPEYMNDGLELAPNDVTPRPEPIEASYAPGNLLWFNWYNQLTRVPVRKHSGLWELPAYCFEAPDSLITKIDSVLESHTYGKVEGLDCTLYYKRPSGVEFTKDEALATLKNTLDKVLGGNRAPMTVGIHSDKYVDNSESKRYVNIRDKMDRRWVIEEFVKYALTKKDVWFVSGAQAIAFCQKPVPAKKFKADSYAEIPVIDSK